METVCQHFELCLIDFFLYIELEIEELQKVFDVFTPDSRQPSSTGVEVLEDDELVSEPAEEGLYSCVSMR